MTIETVYKVTQRIADDLFASAIDRKIKSMCLEYRFNHVTRPKIKGSLIYAFKSPQAAYTFAYACHIWNLAILICRAEVPEDLKFWQYRTIASCPDDLSVGRYGPHQRRTRLVDLFWNDHASYCAEITTWSRHQSYFDSVMCKFVIPLERYKGE